MKFTWLILFLPLFATAEPCSIQSQKGDVCTVTIARMHPTQFNLGLREVETRAQKFAGYSNKKLKKYIQNNPALVVIGPNGEIYCTDHQHLARALENIGIDEMEAEVQGNISNLNGTNFWQEMQKQGWTHLYDLGNGPLSPSQLPDSILNMTDDPYRSLAWFVRDQGGYEDSPILYADFLWADFFRTRIDVGSSDNDFNNAIKEALKLAHSPTAQSLPGWTP